MTDRMPPSIDVGRVRDEAEATAFFRIACEALLVSPSIADAWREREGEGNVRVARVDGKLAGGLAVQRMPQWFGGERVPCGVVRAVAVAPEHRGSRVADAFLRATLAELRADGIPLATLFPATQLIYRRVGFEQAGAWVDYAIPVSELPDRDRSLPVQRVAPGDPALAPLYDTFASRSNGLLDRNPWLWRRTLSPQAPLELSVHLLGPEGAPEGYLVTHTEHDQTQKRGTLRVRDRAFTTPRALVRARSFLAEHRSVVDTVRLNGGLVEPLLVGLSNQLQRPVRREDWMLRIVDVPRALALRGYPDGLEATIPLLVRDDVLEPREARYTLRVRDGAATVEPGGSGAVAVDVRGLAALYSGHMAPAELAALGYLDGDARKASALAAVFAGPTSWMNEIV